MIYQDVHNCPEVEMYLKTWACAILQDGAVDIFIFKGEVLGVTGDINLDILGCQLVLNSWKYS